ncbi:glycerophosphodiester phosphodiesterase family protein [Actinoplanes sp. NPDC051470]|uniref:glycerophosphodiester phosphodiesterase n=1 Tax=unclassified Actinoplanes TaxID=2626549 RepID=UPI0034156A98
MHRVAHRGYSAVAPENTLPALAAAVSAGATHVEFDVRTTADDVPVVIHDRTVDRTTNGTGHVWDLTVDEIRALDAGSWFSPAFAGLKVPLLSEVLALPLADASLLLEIKPPTNADQVKRILTMLGDLAGRTIVQSFDPSVVRLVREVAPDIRRGLLRLRFEADTVALVRDLGVVCCNPSVADVVGAPEMVAELAAEGVEVMPWTANDITEWRALAAAGVAGLITDHAGELTGWAAS